MGSLRRGSAVLSLLTVGALLAASVAVQVHAHHQPAHPQSLAGLPSFDASHDGVDPSPHIEEATERESTGCVVCVLRQHSDATAADRSDPEEAIPASPGEALAAQILPDGSTPPLPGTRAPPSA